jgi:hypothetical protein
MGPIGQLGYAVLDVDRWVEDFLAAGVGPWWTYRALAPAEFGFPGGPTAPRFDCAISFSGGLMLEVIAPVDDEPSPYRDFLASGREGLQHLCYFPDDADAAGRTLVDAGHRCVVDGHTGGFAFRYYEPVTAVGRAGRELVEIGRRDVATRRRHDAMVTVCADWDGRDPRR